jgi:hypothetical protein
MTFDIKVSKDKIYLIDKDESKSLVKKQRKIFESAEKNLTKVVVDRLEGKGGDC